MITNEERKTPEQEARDLLERLGMDEAQSCTAGDVVELANLIAEVRRLANGEYHPSRANCRRGKTPTATDWKSESDRHEFPH
jgi:hypothetical protein